VSAVQLVEKSRKTLATLIGTGAVSAGPETVQAVKGLGAQAHALGLADLGGLFERLAESLRGRGAMAFEPSLAVAELTLGVLDRVEALASTLELWSVEELFSRKQQEPS
jgi:hypothetical protein